MTESSMNMVSVDKAIDRISSVFSIIVCVIISLFVSIYCEMYYEVVTGYWGGYSYPGLIESTLGLNIIFRVLALFTVSMLLSLLVRRYFGRISPYLYKYRYLIGAFFLIIYTVFELNGTSVAFWANYLTDAETTSTIFGIPRAIRSDEWMVSLTSLKSQEFNGYSSVSSILRATQTNVTMTPSLPTWALATLFKPLSWGFLLFGTVKGLSLQWISTKLALFFTGFELAMIYTKKNKALSAAAAILLTFSPFILWWNTGGILIFGQSLVLALYYFLHCKRPIAKVMLSLLLAWLAGCYFLVLYPAWEVPLFYVYAAMGLWVILQYRKKVRKGEIPRTFLPLRDSLLLIVSCVLIAVLVLLVFQNASEAFAATSATVYPAGRVSQGGGLINQVFDYGISLFYAATSLNISFNQCEAVAMFSLFPVGFILGAIQGIRKKDLLCIILVIVETVFLIYSLFGFPEALAKATLLSYSPSERMLFPLGCLDVYLLIRSLCLYSQSEQAAVRSGRSLFILFATTGIVAIIICFLCLSWHAFYIVFASKVVMVVVVSLLVFLVLFSCFLKRKVFISLFAAMISVILLISGICVSPIQMGLDPLTNNQLYASIEKIAKENKGDIWLSEDAWAMGNFCVSAGAPTINSVNFYPYLERWRAFDPDRQYEYIYNRYSHITIKLQSNTETSFRLTAGDAFHVDLNWNDLKKLDVSYILTPNTLSEPASSGIVLTMIEEASGYKIYRVEYI